MKIKSRIKREGGSLITIGDERYHFTPDELGRHIAEVTDPEHIERFLSIPTFEALDDPEPNADVTATNTGETLVPQGEEPDEEEEAELDLEQARQAYFEAFGKKPHHAMHAETMYERIEKGEA